MSADTIRVINQRHVATEAGCWRWLGPVNPNGYGAFRRPGADTLAHRAAYEAHKGAIPDGYHVDHLCRNKLCVNPEHLEAVTPAENYRRDREFRGVGEYSEACSNGHPWTTESTYTHPGSGKRACRICNLARKNAANRALAANGAKS